MTSILRPRAPIRSAEGSRSSWRAPVGGKDARGTVEREALAERGANISTVTTQDTDVAMRPLTALSEDETLFRDSVYEFADREIRPIVREMDEQAKIPRTL